MSSNFWKNWSGRNGVVVCRKSFKLTTAQNLWTTIWRSGVTKTKLTFAMAHLLILEHRDRWVSEFFYRTSFYLFIYILFITYGSVRAFYLPFLLFWFSSQSVQVERANKTISEETWKACPERERWSERLADATFHYNSRWHSTINIPPFVAFYAYFTMIRWITFLHVTEKWWRMQWQN